MVARAIGRIRALVQRLGQGITHPEQELDRLQRFVVFLYDLSRHGGRQLVRDNAPLMAAALAYRTLFSAVPVMVLALVVARSFYGVEGIRRAVEKLMDFTGINELNAVTLAEAASQTSTGAVTSEQTQVVVTQLVQQWVDNAVTRMTTLNYGAITAISVMVFIYAALILFVQIEESFNTVCQAARGRRWITRLTTYWTLLTLGSVGVIASVAITRVWIDATSSLPGWASWATGPMQYLGNVAVVWLLLLFAYTRMPNTRVRLRPAACGALVAAALWEVGKWLLVLFVRKTAGGQLEVYGSLALIPIALFWVYCIWLVVLFGLEVAWTIQTVGESKLRERESAEARKISAVDPTAGVVLMRHLAAAFRDGKSVDTDDLARRARLPEVLVQQVMGKLVETGLVHRVVKGNDDDGLALARPPESILLREVAEATMRLAPAAADPGGQDEAAGLRAAMLKGFEDRRLA